MEASPIATGLHALAAIIWVGGMFFAYMILRPAVSYMQGPDRLTMWQATFQRFFPWVWVSVVMLPATGYWIVFVDIGAFEWAGLHIHIMHGLAIIMIALYVYLYFRPYARFRTAVTGDHWKDAAHQLAIIRKIVGFNLILGLLTSAVGASGRLWSAF